MDETISDIRKDYLSNLIKSGKRLDKRPFDKFRDIHIKTNVISKAEGSARVRIGKTQVAVGVKIQPGEPFADSPDKGVQIVNAELIPLASPAFESGPPNENSIELARLVDRGIRQSKALGLEKLCIEEGKLVWIIFIDIHVLNDSGNLLDASALGAVAALLTTKLPNEEFGQGVDEMLPLNDLPILVSIVEFEGELLVDPGLLEEQLSSTKLTFIFNQDGSICGSQKGNIGTLTEDKIIQAMEMASEKAIELRELLREV